MNMRSLTLAGLCLLALNDSVAQKKRTVYMVGVSIEVGIGQTPVYWKDGVMTKLPGGRGEAKSIFVHGDEIHIVGYNEAEERYPQYWKNGEPFPLDKEKAGQVSSIFLSGSDVYMAGTAKAKKRNSNYPTEMAAYWKNGALMTLTSNETEAETNNIVVSGKSVYVGGNECCPGFKTAKYWKNGKAVSLSDGKRVAEARDIYVSGNDVYVVGNVSYADGYVATLWKNGVVTELAPRTSTSEARSVVVVDGDVYVAGYEIVDKIWAARCWKNGVPMPVDRGNGQAFAFDLAVQ
jgi:hypothetical protein